MRVANDVASAKRGASILPLLPLRLTLQRKILLSQSAEGGVTVPHISCIHILSLHPLKVSANNTPLVDMKPFDPLNGQPTIGENSLWTPVRHEDDVK
jgi:hypothetical protein